MTVWIHRFDCYIDWILQRGIIGIFFTRGFEGILSCVTSVYRTVFGVCVCALQYPDQSCSGLILNQFLEVTQQLTIPWTRHSRVPV